MNTTATITSENRQRYPTRAPTLDRDRDRITLGDRISIRFGLWLLLRAERRIARSDTDRVTRLGTRRQAREAYELATVRAQASSPRIY